MAYIDDHALLYTTENDLHKKVTRAIDKAARDVTNESEGTANHSIRLMWAEWIRHVPDRAIREAHRAMMYVLDNVTVATAGNASTDTDVQFVVNSLVDTLAVGGYR